MKGSPMPEKITCEWGGCVEPAVFKVTAYSRQKRMWLEDKIKACFAHAELLSAQHETGPGAKIHVTREPLQ